MIMNFRNKGDKAVSYLLRNIYKNLTFLTDENNVGVNFEKLIEMYLTVPCQKQENSVTAEVSFVDLAAPEIESLNVERASSHYLVVLSYGYDHTPRG